MNAIAQEVPEDQKQIESAKLEEISKWVIDFKYNGHTFKITSNGHRINIIDENGFDTGVIVGSYTQDEKTSEVIFHVNEVGNASVLDAEEGPPTFTDRHIPYLVAESIAQIILSGKIDKWISSEGTNSGSDKMYMHIEEEGHIEVQTIQNRENFQYHYELTRKK